MVFGGSRERKRRTTRRQRRGEEREERDREEREKERKERKREREERGGPGAGQVLVGIGDADWSHLVVLAEDDWLERRSTSSPCMPCICRPRAYDD